MAFRWDEVGGSCVDGVTRFAHFRPLKLVTESNKATTLVSCRKRPFCPHHVNAQFFKFYVHENEKTITLSLPHMILASNHIRVILYAGFCYYSKLQFPLDNFRIRLSNYNYEYMGYANSIFNATFTVFSSNPHP